MMRITINDRDRSDILEQMDPPGNERVMDVLERIARELEEQGRVVAGLRLDGEDLTGREREELEERRPELLEVTAKDPLAMIRDSAELNGQWIATLKTEISTCADRFRVGDEVQAIESLVKVIEGLQVLMLSVNQILRLGTLCLSPEDTAGICDFQNGFTSLLSEVVEAQENRDWIMLADLLEYELAESLDAWASAAKPLLPDQSASPGRGAAR